MTYVITEPCIDVLDQSCVSVCPVDCIHFEQGTDRMLAIDPDEYAEVINLGVRPPANGPFAPGSPAYLEDTGYPSSGDPAEAERLVAEYEAEVGPLRPVVLSNTPDTLSQEQSVYLQQTLEAVGLPVVPADAWPEIVPLARWVLERGGGQGCVRELCDAVWRSRTTG